MPIEVVTEIVNSFEHHRGINFGTLTCDSKIAMLNYNAHHMVNM